MGLLEGTTLSTGRGTTRPFEIFGAPFLDVRAFGGCISQPSVINLAIDIL